MTTISKTYSITNTSDKYLLVGNCHHIIAAYESAQDAAADIDSQVPCIDSSPWGSVQVVAPGDTVSGDYCQPIPRTAKQDAELAEQMAAMPWMIQQPT
ncbi:MAG: hypothetical protein ACEQSB_05710 [Undibacterium sp.]